MYDPTTKVKSQFALIYSTIYCHFECKRVSGSANCVNANRQASNLYMITVEKSGTHNLLVMVDRLHNLTLDFVKSNPFSSATLIPGQPFHPGCKSCDVRSLRFGATKRLKFQFSVLQNYSPDLSLPRQVGGS